MTATDEEARELVRGAWDLHVHAAPSLFPRRGDARELARACAEAGMRGVVIKAHHGSTVETAARVQVDHPGLTVHGGVVLNGFVGGLNPLAVEACLRLGGRLVWLPTIHAREHGRVFGALGSFPGDATDELPGRCLPPGGLSILDAGGGLLPEIREILALLHRQPAVLATGHISFGEVLALKRHVEARGLSIRLLVNHALFRVPALTVEQLRRLQAPWVCFETCYFTISPLSQGAATPAQVAATILELKGARWIMASDSGQPHNPPAPRALQAFCAALRAHGVDHETLDAMLRRHPAELLAP